MSTATLNTVDSSGLSKAQETFRSRILSPWLFKFYLLKELPMAFLAGIKVNELDRNQSKASIKFSWLTQNPFKSTYFACLSMAGEMVQGLIIIMASHGVKPRISTLPVEMKSEFIKKATGKTTFTCNEGDKIFNAIDQAIQSQESVTFQAVSIGRNNDGEEVARFTITWSLKQKSVG